MKPSMPAMGMVLAAALATATLSLMQPGAALAHDDERDDDRDWRGNGSRIDPRTWVYGPRNDDTSGGLVWNPVKKKLLEGKRFVARTVQGTFPATSDTTYCNLASQPLPTPRPDLIDPDFTWTEMQHSGLTWGDAWRMWAHGSSANCPNRKAIPGVRIAYTNEQEIQHALDGGAMVLVVPTVDTAEEAAEIVRWAYFPPFGRRSQGGSQTAAVLAPWIPAGVNYRQTFNNNLVLIVMLETIEAVKNRHKIAAVPGVHAVFAASGDLANFSGWAQGDAQYERLITAVHDAAMKAGKKLCGPFAWSVSPADAGGVNAGTLVPRPDFSCFQN
jgi:4-hydroxy-2-oxoheptanedioate aldolase